VTNIHNTLLTADGTDLKITVLMKNRRTSTSVFGYGRISTHNIILLTHRR